MPYKKCLSFLLTLALLISVCAFPKSALAAGDGVQTELYIDKGNIDIQEEAVSGFDASGNAVTTHDPDGYIITQTDPNTAVTDYCVMVYTGSHAITLRDVNIDLSIKENIAALFINTSAKVDLTLSGNNKLKSGTNCAGLLAPSNAILTIEGDGSLEAYGGDGGAGIGGADGNIGYTSSSGGTIIISGGTIIAQGTGGGAGIGGGNVGYGGAVFITGGSVKAVGGGGGADIGAGSGGVSGDFSNEAGTDLELVTVTLSGATDGTTVTDFSERPDYYGMDGVKTIGDKIYLYLPKDDHTIYKALTGGITRKLYVSAAQTGDEVMLVESFDAVRQSATPAASVTTVNKAAATQKSVAFTLTTPPTGRYKVYESAVATDVMEDVTASLAGNTLTLSSTGDDLAAGKYYVSVTESCMLESDRLELTVGAYVPLSDPDNNTFSIGEGAITIEPDSDNSKLKVSYGASQTALVPKSESITIIGSSFRSHQKRRGRFRQSRHRHA